MRIRRTLSRLILSALIAGGVMTQQWLAADDGASGKHRALPPKKWDSRTVDTFFSDARSILDGDRPTFGDGKNVVAKTPAGDNSGGGATAPAGGGDAPAPGEFAWSKLIAPESLMDEIKSYQALVKDDVSNPSKFKGEGFKRARKNYSVLALLFGVIAEYDGDVRWKSQAATVRDSFARSAANCKVATDGSYGDSKQRAEDLEALIRGDTLPAGPPSEAKPQWAKVSARPPLMSRLETAQQNRIAVWTANQGDFTKNVDGIFREAQIIAVIAEAIQQDGYDFTDDNSYKGFAREMQKEALAIADAAKSKNFDQARLSAGNLAKACSNCHGSFRQ